MPPRQERNNGYPIIVEALNQAVVKGVFRVYGEVLPTDTNGKASGYAVVIDPTQIKSFIYL